MYCGTELHQRRHDQHPRLVVASDSAEISGSAVLLFFQGRATRSATIIISRLGSDHSLMPGLGEVAAARSRPRQVDSSEVEFLNSRSMIMMIRGQGAHWQLPAKA